MALTPNFRKVESLLDETGVCGEQTLLALEVLQLTSSDVTVSVLAVLVPEAGGDMLGGGPFLGR